MHMCYERPGVVAPLNGGVGQYEKWDRERGGSSGSGGGGGGGGGSGGGSGSAWAGRDRERDRERERLARAHQMSHAHQPEPDASSLFPAPFRVTGNRDHVSQQIQHKLGDYHLAQSLIDDPSKSIGIYAEPQSPAPCTRRESEFKKPAHAPTNGRIHHRSYLSSKSDVPGSTGASAHRPPPLKIPNGFQNKNPSDSSQPPIESILKEMKSLPTPLSVIAATPRKELENKFIFNPYTNKVQENPQLSNNDLKTPLPKPGIDDRISNSRSSASPDVVNKDLVLSESDDEVGAATTTSLEPLITPIASASPSSGSSSPSDSESESSSAESSATPQPTPAPAPPPAQRSSWSLSNFAPPPAQPPDLYDGKELRHALADVKGKPSPISDMSDSEASSPSPVAVRRRRSLANRASAASSDEDTSRTHNTQSSPRVPTAQKRGRPPKQRSSAAEEDNPPKKKRGRPRKSSAPPPPAPAAPPADSDPEPDPPPPPPPPPHIPAQDNKTHIFRKVFTPKKGDECGGKGGKGGKGKGGKGKGQVTIIEVTAPELGADDDERINRERSTERRNEEAVARVSPPQETEMRRLERDHRIPDRQERIPTDRITADRERSERDRLPAERERLQDRLPTERDRLPIERDRLNAERERIPTDRDRLPTDRERIPTDRDRLPTERDRIPAERERMSTERIPTERERIQTERTSNDRIPNERPPDRISTERMVDRRLPSDRTPVDRIRPAIERERIEDRKKKMRLSDEVERIDDKMGIEKLEDKVMDRLSGDKMSERIQTDRYVKAEADVGSGLKLGRGSERLVEASSNGSIRSRLMVRVPLSRLRREVLRALQRPPPAPARPRAPRPPQHQEVVVATNHERTAAGETIRYFSYFERLPSDALSDEDRDHKYYLDEATRLRQAAVIEQEPLARVMLYLESVLCFVLTGRVLELRELDSKGAFTVYRETIEYIKSIHSMPQRYRASPHSTFNKLDILSLRVQALLYLRMFKMYNREVKEYNKIVQEYQQKPACAEAAASPLSPTPSPGGSVGSVGSGGSSGYCSLAHSVPAHAHHALLQLTKYYTFLYVAHDLWEQADCLCRLRPNQELFIAVDRKCGPLSLSSTFRHLVQYVRYAISLLKSAHRE